MQGIVILSRARSDNEEQIISRCSIDGAISVRVDGGFGSYRWFVYITTLLLRDASWILILHCGTHEPPQRHLYYQFCWNLIPIWIFYIWPFHYSECSLNYCTKIFTSWGTYVIIYMTSFYSKVIFFFLNWFWTTATYLGMETSTRADTLK